MNGWLIDSNNRSMALINSVGLIAIHCGIHHGAMTGLISGVVGGQLVERGSINTRMGNNKSFANAPGPCADIPIYQQHHQAFNHRQHQPTSANQHLSDPDLRPLRQHSGACWELFLRAVGAVDRQLVDLHRCQWLIHSYQR